MSIVGGLGDEAGRPLQPDRDWPFFDADFFVPPQVLAQVQALTPHAAALLWTRHVSAHPAETHPMQLRAGHRLQPRVSGPDWLAEFDAVPSEHPAQSGRVAAFLVSHFQAAGAAPVLFMASRARAYALTPAALAACRPCLLAISDEGPLLYQPATGKFVWCRPHGAQAGGEEGQELAS
ncbi:hypothetical protein GCN74_10795 [Janthinobacterium sp. FT14W]|uniref:hypothetical protein n=1 Tax=Janthinobacterium sp. FT14W TaxID=2654253 RepID=UPI0012640DF0|nr:hypothetical protein [Janthinobacterium sp. FT14W]KAB8059862.1 hypothetical protein GCN74_10795 [Janthinobacterium sp. FT14W]